MEEGKEGANEPVRELQWCKIMVKNACMEKEVPFLEGVSKG